jgi:hypothetical protein
MSIRKGDIVRAIGSRGRCFMTPDELNDWYQSEQSKGMDCAGETRLPPRSYIIELDSNKIYQVLRARCRVSLGYGNPTPGMACILDTQSGREIYIKRDQLALAK